MPVTVAWDNDDHTTICINLIHPWGWVDYDTGIAQVYGLMNSVEHTVNVISNIPQGTSFPMGNVLLHFRHTTESLPENIGQIVVSGGNLAANIVIAIFGRAYSALGSRLAFANNLEEARTLLTNLAPPNNSEDN
ncbi:MAG: hypothetical protein ABI947_24715 [Chloroflexota bacterium]